MSDEKKAAPAVMPHRKKEAAQARNHWVVTVEPGVTRQDLMRPDFWAHMGKDFRPYDRVEVRCDDGTFFAEYIVRTADRTWANVQELAFHMLGTQDISMTQAQILEERGRYRIEYRGPHLMHCVERKDGKDYVRLKEKCQDKAEAGLWLENHLKTVGVAAVPA